MKVWTSGVKAVLLVLGLILLMPQPGHAIPAFARKFGVKCYTCHTIPPALNKNGYMFKRLGYRMPPDEMDGTKPAPKVYRAGQGHQVQPDQLLRSHLAGQRYRRQDTSQKPDSIAVSHGSEHQSPCSSFNLDEAALFVAGAVPETGFSYFGHYEMYQDGKNNLEQGFGV